MFQTVNIPKDKKIENFERILLTTYMEQSPS